MYGRQGSVGGVSVETGSVEGGGTVRVAQGSGAERPPVRGPATRRVHAALRLPAAGRGRAGVLVGAERTVAGPEGQAARRSHRGPPAGVRRVRRRDPRGPVRS